MNGLLQYRFLPIVICGAFFFIYAASDFLFVQCKGLELCTGIESTNMSQVANTALADPDGKPTDKRHLAQISAQIKHKLADIEIRENRLQTFETQFEATKTALDTTRKEIIKEKAAANALTANNVNTATNTATNSATNTPANTNSAANAQQVAGAKLAELEKKEKTLDGVLKTQEIDKKSLEADRDKALGEVVAVRTQTASRYANRMTWVFLTGVFFLLCIAAIVSSWRVIADSTGNDRNLWLATAATAAVGIPLVIFLWNNTTDGKTYMALVTPMFNQSIAALGDVSLTTISLLNVFGFASTIFLVFASCAVLSSVAGKSSGGDFKPEKQNIKAVLYVGALMLFVGVLRIKLLSDWHLLFVSLKLDDPFYKLLADFFRTSIAVQAGFYTILLTLIYLPVAYAISEKEDKPATDDKKMPNIFQRLGLPITADFVVKFLAVLSPALAGPVIELFKLLFGGTS